MHDVVIAILAGGSGTRFWPLSRRAFPKQFLSLDESGRSLLRVTADRVLPLVGDYAAMCVVTTEAHAQLAESHVPGVAIIAEPQGRNTAASIGLAALGVVTEEDAKSGHDPVMVVLPADHVITEHAAFRSVLADAITVAHSGEYLVTLGIQPTSPHTGYGYIKCGASLEKGLRVDRFVEKPPLDQAREYLRAGNYFWNSGMFVWRRSAILRALEKHMPDLLIGLRGVVEEWRRTGALPADRFAALPSVSIDYGVLEKATNCAVIPTESIGWSDVGSFEAWADHFPATGEQNVVRGDSLLIDSERCIVQAEGLHIAAVGLKDIAVIGTKDAVLVCSREKLQEVRRVVERLAETGRTELI